MMMRGLWARHPRRAAAVRLGMLLAVTVAMMALAGSPAAAGDAERVTEIQVAGQAELRVNPDVATVVLTVETQAESAPLAQEANATRVAVIRAALEELGVPRDAVTTGGFRLTPIWRERSPSGTASRTGTTEPPVIVAYRVSHDLHIEVTDLERLGELVDAAVKAGADRVSYIDFGISDAMPYRDELLQAAYADAEAKARSLTAAAGLVLIGPSHIGEAGYSPFPARSVARVSAADAFALSTEIEPGEQRLSVYINVTFLARKP